MISMLSTLTYLYRYVLDALPSYNWAVIHVVRVRAYRKGESRACVC